MLESCQGVSDTRPPVSLWFWMHDPDSISNDPLTRQFVRLPSPLLSCDGCWVRVCKGKIQETRYEINGKTDKLEMTSDKVFEGERMLLMYTTVDLM
jgi:hypothetical protein